ncbi:hypothetical protein H8M03_11160 [Sphingomonas sabuli]|uniref:Anti-sigma factor NepR domain-containing protein n=1 Tax=Sphingomonas sabuli TaxID=2764186 RepID=A0A7G9L652_9SPHN|nr:hypothetical protein H8M03_11160 [Sphingomonas sabuli]
MGDEKSAKTKREKKDDGGKRADKSGGRVSSVGRALRTVYDETLREDVPDDFLDLLGKLS